MNNKKIKKIKNVYDKNINLGNFDKERTSFFQTFGSKTLFAYNGNPANKISPMIKTGSVSLIKTMNMVFNTHDAYFYVNGSSKISEVKSFKTCFIDLDAGRDSSGKYLGAKQVATHKKKFLTAIQQFSLEPTWIVDTRNGYQCYWLLTPHPKVSLEVWNGLQKKLANYFSSDTLAIKANQLLRVPFTYWHKPWEGKVPYFVSLLGRPKTSGGRFRYSVQELQDALQGVSTTIKHIKNRNSTEWQNKVHKDPFSVKNETIDNYCSSYSTAMLAAINQRPSITHTPPNKGEDPDTTHNAKDKLLSETIDFLRHVSKTLYYSDNKYLSQAGYKLAESVAREFCIG